MVLFGGRRQSGVWHGEEEDGTTGSPFATVIIMAKAVPRVAVLRMATVRTVVLRGGSFDLQRVPATVGKGGSEGADLNFVRPSHFIHLSLVSGEGRGIGETEERKIFFLRYLVGFGYQWIKLGGTEPAR